jgi:hypothetical protein
MRDLKLKHRYSSSHALVIGINQYLHMPPLAYAAKDAVAFARVLEDSFSVPKGNVTLYIDKDATRAAILSAYMAYSRTTDQDSRLIIFFAGHGSTTTGSEGEVGFLIPQEGKTSDLSTLIRWQEFTVNADLIPAKHILFIMDACYGGLVFNRAVAAGGVRFLKDMMLRRARQALTAGKGDEIVADGNGPHPEHSIFTGHLLIGLAGEARAPEGHLTATGLMSYVCKQVSNDIRSKQTPHYGRLSGDGDFIFSAPALETIPPTDTGEIDELITVPSIGIPEEMAEATDPFATAKRYLSDPAETIALHDFVMRYVRKLVAETPNERLPVTMQFEVEEFKKRLVLCDEATQDLRRILGCASFWGGEGARSIIRKAFSRMTDHLSCESGLTIWNSLRWYPTILLSYASGIAGIANKNYSNLSAVFMAPIPSLRNTEEQVPLFLGIGTALVDIVRSGAFKHLPGHERYHVAHCEYVFKLLQPELDDDLFLGKEYESLFDRFEVFLALANATRRKKLGHLWGPIGRFGWKINGSNPLGTVMGEAKEQGDNWAPFRAGLFGSDYDYFISAAEEYVARVANHGWGLMA